MRLPKRAFKVTEEKIYVNTLTAGSVPTKLFTATSIYYYPDCTGTAFTLEGAIEELAINEEAFDSKKDSEVDSPF